MTYLDDIKWYRIEKRLEDLKEWTKMKKVLFNTRKSRTNQVRRFNKMHSEMNAMGAWSQRIAAFLAKFPAIYAQFAIGKLFIYFYWMRDCLYRAGTVLFFINETFLEDEMITGTVKWFNSAKGFGFIQPDNGGADVFVHISAVEQAGLRDLQENQKIGFELIADPKKGKTSAGNLKLIWSVEAA